MTQQDKPSDGLCEIARKIKERNTAWGLRTVLNKDSELAKFAQKPNYPDEIISVEAIKGDRYLTMHRGKCRPCPDSDSKFVVDLNGFKEPNK